MAQSKFRMFVAASGKMGVGSVIFAIVFLSVGVFEHSEEKNITVFAEFLALRTFALSRIPAIVGAFYGVKPSAFH